MLIGKVEIVGIVPTPGLKNLEALNKGKSLPHCLVEMKSIVANLRQALELKGEYVVLANISTGWFAISLKTWQERDETAKSNGREGPNLVFYKTTSANQRDHYVIPYSVTRNLLIKDTMTEVKATGSPRWNLVLKDGLLHVTHGIGKVDVSKYYSAPLLIEATESAIAEEVGSKEIFREGSVRTILVNAYERNRMARDRCIAHYGTHCAVCLMSFAKFYGPEAAEIIHVHHLIELSKIGEDYEVDPIKDLRPVCPNCHAVIHSRKIAYSIEEVAALVQSNACGEASDRKVTD